MANQYLNQFSPKTTPVGADIVYIGDSTNSFIEAKSTIGQIISNNAIVVKSAATSGHLAIWSSSTQVGDSGIAVDGSANVTGVANLTVGNLDGKIGANNPTIALFTTVTSSALTSGQMLYATTAGLIANSGIAIDSSQNITGVGGLRGAGTGQFANFNVTTLTSGQVVVAGASGALTGSSALTLSGNVFSITASSGIAANVASPKATYHFATGSTILSGTSAITTGNLANNEINPYISGNDLLFNYKTNSGSFYTLDFNNYMLKASNLSDVASATTAFNNISPLTSKGDLLTSNGASSVRFPAGADGYILSYDSTQTSGLIAIPQSAAAAFVDNAMFIGTSGQAVATSTPTGVLLDTLLNSTTGNRWSLNGDNLGMKCGNAGWYWFNAMIPVYAQLSGGGYCYFRFALNGTLTGPTMPINLPTTFQTVTVSVMALIQCAVNDVVTLRVYSSTPANTYMLAFPATSGAPNVSSVSVIRLL